MVAICQLAHLPTMVPDPCPEVLKGSAPLDPQVLSLHNSCLSIWNLCPTQSHGRYVCTPHSKMFFFLNKGIDHFLPQVPCGGLAPDLAL